MSPLQNIMLLPLAAMLLSTVVADHGSSGHSNSNSGHGSSNSGHGSDDFGNDNICQTLDSRMPGRVGYPGTDLYNNSQSTYYTTSMEGGLNPSCVFKPESVAEVSLFMKLANPDNDANTASEFAVRAGGHMLFAGAANIDCGVTVDMRGFNTTTLSEDKALAYIGGGSVFSSEVYPALVPHNLTVLGGRFPGIAVGGFTTGGEWCFTDAP
jgi:hypothetical protein